MKKILIAFTILISLNSCSFAAENDDIYVRKDLFESYMKNIDSKLEKIDKNIEILTQSVAELNVRMTKLETKVDGVYAALSNRIDGLEKRVDDLREDTKGRIGDLNNSIYLWSVILGLVAGLPFFKNLFDEYQAKKQAQRQYFTREEMESFFEKMFEAKMKGKLNNAV